MAPKIFNAHQFLKDEFGLEIVSKDPENPGLVEVKDIAATKERGNVGAQAGAQVLGTTLMNMAGPLGAIAGMALGEDIGRSAAESQVPVTKKFDLAALMKDLAAEQGLSFQDLQAQTSDADTPLTDSALNFVDRVKFTQTRTDKDKAGFLAEQFGQQNVRKNKAGEFVVNRDGDWFKADDNFVANLVSESPVIAASIAGAKLGGAIGTAAEPGLGTIAGAGIGAGIGAAVAKLGTLAAANAAGLRTEDDAKQVATEVGKEFLFGLAGEVAVPVVKLAGRQLIGSMANATTKISKAATGDTARLAIAETMQQLTGVDVVDNMTYLKAPKQVAQYQGQVLDWMKKGMQDVNPIQKEMGDMTQTIVQTAKDNMYKQYDKALQAFEGSTKGVKINVEPVISNTLDQFKTLGLVDETGKWLKGSEAQLQKIVDPKSVNRIKQVWNILNRATQEGLESGKGARLPLQDTQTLISNMDEVLEAAGAYSRSQGEVALSTPAKRQLMQVRTNLKNQLIQGLESVNPKAAESYRAMNSSFSDMRGWLDELAGGTADDKVGKTIEKILNNDPIKRDAFINVLEQNGVNKTIFLDGLAQRKAAIATAPMYRPSGGPWNVVPAQLGVTSPRRTTKISANAFDMLKGAASATEFVKKLSPAERAALVKNPAYLQTLTQSIGQSVQRKQEVKDQLLAPLNQGQGQGQGGPQ